MIPGTNKTAAAALIAAIERKVDPDQVATALVNALSSTTTTRAGVVEPDTRSQLQAVGMLTALIVGTPIQRSEIRLFRQICG